MVSYVCDQELEGMCGMKYIDKFPVKTENTT